MTTATAEKVIVEPFGVEVSTPNCGDLVLQSIPGCKLRGANRPTKTVRKVVNHVQQEAEEVATHPFPVPETPGQQIHVNPAKLSYMIIDPMERDERLCDRLNKVVNRNKAVRSDTKLRGVPSQKGDLDAHRMKTLCRELINVVEANEGKVVKGVLPSREQVDKLPGKYLLNPGATLPNTQPRYEEDYDEWVSTIASRGG